MDPTDEEIAAQIESLRRAGHVLELPEVAIEGDPEADPKEAARAEHAANLARRAAEEAREATASTPDEGSIADYLSLLPENVEMLDFLPTPARRALADYLGTGTAGASGLVSGATMGFGDEIGGGLAAAGAALTGGDAGEAYETARDRMRAISNRDREASPLAFGAGEVGGALLTAPLLPAAAPVSGSRAARVAAALGEGALYGGAAGAGHSDADLSTEEGRAAFADDVGEGVIGGGLAGAGGAAAIEAGGAGIGAIGRYLRGEGAGADRARVASVISSAGAPLSVRTEERLATLPGGIPGVAERIRRLGIGSRMGTMDDALEAVTRAERTTGERAGAFNEAVDAALPYGLPVERYAGVLDKLAGDAATRPARVAEVPRIERMAGEWRSAARPPEIPMSDHISGDRAREALADLGRRASEARVRESEITGDMLSTANRRLRDVYDDAAEGVLGPGSREAYRGARHDYATTRMLGDAARRAAARRARSGMSLGGSVMAAGERARGGSMLGAETLAALRGAYAARRPAMEATARETARSLAPAVERAGSASTPRGSGRLAAVLEEMLGGASPPAAEAPASSADDFGFVPDEAGEDDFGFMPDEEAR